MKALDALIKLTGATALSDDIANNLLGGSPNKQFSMLSLARTFTRSNRIKLNVSRSDLTCFSALKLRTKSNCF